MVEYWVEDVKAQHQTVVERKRLPFVAGNAFVDQGPVVQAKKIGLYCATLFAIPEGGPPAD